MRRERREKHESVNFKGDGYIDEKIVEDPFIFFKSFHIMENKLEEDTLYLLTKNAKIDRRKEQVVQLYIDFCVLAFQMYCSRLASQHLPRVSVRARE